MSLRHAQRVAEDRLRLLELEASMQRMELAATFDAWGKRKALAWGASIAGWGFKLFRQPRVSWLIASTLLSRFRGRRAR